MDNYTDEYLRERLQVYGQDVGPINNSTRLYWQKALTKLTLQHDVSPITKCPSEKRVKKGTPLSHKNRRNATCRSRSVDCPKHAVLSESDLSEWENDSILTDSPGSTPFPAKVSRNKKFSSNQIVSSNEAADRSTRHTLNQKKYISMTPKSTRNSEEINLDNKSTRIQQRVTDRGIIEKLNEFGEHVPRGPMNAATRNEWKKRLDKLMSADLSPVESYSDSEIMCPLFYGSRMRKKNRNGTAGIQNIYDEEYEDLDYSKLEYECCGENVHTSKMHLSECLKFFFRFLLKGMFFIIVSMVVVLLVSPMDPPEDDFEADVK